VFLECAEINVKNATWVWVIPGREYEGEVTSQLIFAVSLVMVMMLMHGEIQLKKQTKTARTQVKLLVFGLMT